MKRAWFRDEESGRYYRNIPLNLQEREKLLSQFWGWWNPLRAWRAHRGLLTLEQEAREMRQAHDRLLWVDALPRGHRLAKRAPFRESHPHITALHGLDEL